MKREVSEQVLDLGSLADDDPVNYEYLAERFPALTRGCRDQIEKQISNIKDEHYHRGGKILAGSESLGQFAEFVSGAGPQQGAWKKFLNHKGVSAEEERSQWQPEATETLKIQSSGGYLSLPQQIALQLFTKAQSAAREEAKAAQEKRGRNWRRGEEGPPKTRLQLNRERLERNEELLLKVLKGRSHGLGSGFPDSTVQHHMNEAIKVIEEYIAVSSSAKLLTGLEKWQLAVKYVAMRRNPEVGGFLERHGATKELVVGLSKTHGRELRKQRKEGEAIAKKKLRTDRHMIAQMLRLRRTQEHLLVTREEELVPRDFQGERYELEAAEHLKLMDVPDGEANEGYLGTKEPPPHKGQLARIMESYQNSEDADEDLQTVNQSTIDDGVGYSLPKLSPTGSCLSLQQPVLAGPPFSRLNGTPLNEASALPALPRSPVCEPAATRGSAPSGEERAIKDYSAGAAPKPGGKKKKHLRHATLRYQPAQLTVDDVDKAPRDHSQPQPQLQFQEQEPERAEWPHRTIECLDKLEASLQSPRRLPSPSRANQDLLDCSLAVKERRPSRFTVTSVEPVKAKPSDGRASPDLYKGALSGLKCRPGDGFSEMAQSQGYAAGSRLNNQTKLAKPARRAGQPPSKPRRNEGMKRGVAKSTPRYQFASTIDVGEHSIASQPAHAHEARTATSIAHPAEKQFKLPNINSALTSADMQSNSIMGKGGASGYGSPRTQRMLDLVKHPRLKTERSLDLLAKDIEANVLQFQRVNVDFTKKPAPGESAFSQEVSPDRLLQRVARLDETLGQYDTLVARRGFLSLGLAERAKQQREVNIRRKNRLYKTDER